MAPKVVAAWRIALISDQQEGLNHFWLQNTSFHALERTRRAACTCKRNLSSLTRNKHHNLKTHAKDLQRLQKSLFSSLIRDVIVAVALALRKLPKVAKRTTRFAAAYSKVTRLNHKRSRRGGFRRSSYFIRFVPLVAWQPRDVFHSSKNHHVFLTV